MGASSDSKTEDRSDAQRSAAAPASVVCLAYMSHCSSATIAMDPGGRIGPPGPRELVGSISNSLFTLFRTLTSTNSDITMYLVHHAVKDINENRHVWTKLDESYAVYEEQANHCRRLWMKLRASAEEISSTKATGSSSFAPEPRLRGRSPSPLEYQSEHGEDGPAKAIAPMDIDPVGAEGDDHRPPTLQAVDPPPQKQKPKVHRCLMLTQSTIDAVLSLEK